MSDLIERQDVLDALDKIEEEVADGYGYMYEKWRRYIAEMPSVQPEERTETHSCDLISRQAAIDAYGDWYVEEGPEEGFIGTVKQLLETLPAAQPDPSSYSDKLWRAAYERGKAEAQRKKGKWFRVAYAQEYKYQCDQCGRFHRAMYDFCPSCGSYNGGEQDE